MSEKDVVPGSDIWSDRIRSRAKKLSQALDQGYLELAEILWKVYDTPIGNDPARGPVYKAWGYDTFSDYAELELGLQKRRAERLRQIWAHMEVRLEGRMSAALKRRIYALGWSKVREIAPLLTPENAEKWIEEAESCSVVALQQKTKTFRQRLDELRMRKIREAEGDVLEPTTEDFSEEEKLLNQAEFDPHAMYVKAKTFAWGMEQHETVEHALARAKDITGSDSSSHNMSLICLDFLATNSFLKKKSPENVSTFLNKMETNLGVRLIAIGASDDVVYGIDVLKKLAGDE